MLLLLLFAAAIVDADVCVRRAVCSSPGTDYTISHLYNVSCILVYFGFLFLIGVSATSVDLTFHLIEMNGMD